MTAYVDGLPVGTITAPVQLMGFNPRGGGAPGVTLARVPLPAGTRAAMRSATAGQSKGEDGQWHVGYAVMMLVELDPEGTPGEFAPLHGVVPGMLDAWFDGDLSLSRITHLDGPKVVPMPRR